MTFFKTQYDCLFVSGDRVNGQWTPNETLGTFLGSVQPLSGKDTALQAIGKENVGKVKIYTDTYFNPPTPGTTSSTSTGGDKISFDGYWWEIVARFPYRSGIIDHYKYVAEIRSKV